MTCARSFPCELCQDSVLLERCMSQRFYSLSFKHRLKVSGNFETNGPGALDSFLKAVFTPSQHWAPVIEPPFLADTGNFSFSDAFRTFDGWTLFINHKVSTGLQTMQTLLELSKLLMWHVSGIAITPCSYKLIANCQSWLSVTYCQTWFELWRVELYKKWPKGKR